MKSALKKVLSELNLIDAARNLYNSAKTINGQLLLSEINYRRNGLPDNYPAPPSDLIFLIIGLRWATVYWNGGKEVYNEVENVLRKNSIKLGDTGSVLDFGCGCGRIIRHFYFNNKNLRFFGSDYNPVLINWCRENLSFADFSVNQLSPPMNYGNENFNMIYARSVFTHIGADLQKSWMKEFHRVLKAGGYLYITTHGESTFRNLDKNVIDELTQNQIAVVNDAIAGDNKCTVFQTKKFFENNLMNGFELIDFIPAGTQNKMSQDIYLFRKINN
jgi:ubiquinone/menaquinone biosynthesis C-methylase UbiE